jgi:phage shock protein PspC (stress-responsive transcriptional regulator)
MEWNLRNLARSDQDALAGGVCGGLGEHTPVPSWLWRAIFVALALAWGVGLPIYVALWVFMPGSSTSTGPDHVA